jgi:hypothetical protein
LKFKENEGDGSLWLDKWWKSRTKKAVKMTWKIFKEKQRKFYLEKEIKMKTKENLTIYKIKSKNLKTKDKKDLIRLIK